MPPLAGRAFFKPQATSVATDRGETNLPSPLHPLWVTRPVLSLSRSLALSLSRSLTLSHISPPLRSFLQLRRTSLPNPLLPPPPPPFPYAKRPSTPSTEPVSHPPPRRPISRPTSRPSNRLGGREKGAKTENPAHKPNPQLSTACRETAQHRCRRLQLKTGTGACRM